MDDSSKDHAALESAEAGPGSSDADHDKERLVEYSTSELRAAEESADEKHAGKQGQVKQACAHLEEQ